MAADASPLIPNPRFFASESQSNHPLFVGHRLFVGQAGDRSFIE